MSGGLAALVLSSGLSAAPIARAQVGAEATACAWSVVPVSSGAITYANRFEAVAAVSANDVWAVGWLGGFAAIQRWNGSTWTKVTVPAIPGATQSRLLGIDAAGPTDIWAVGYAIVADAYKTVTMHWNGSAWSLVTSPNQALVGLEVINAINDVSIVAANDVWAVGGDIRNFNANTSEAVLMHWDGTKWTLVTPPPESIATADASRNAVDASSSGDVWALGDTGELRWNGSQWRYAGISSQATVGVVALTTNNAWAVGTTPRRIVGFEVFPADPYASQWNGNTWVRTSLPKVATGKGTGDTFVRAVDALSATDIWAVGLTGQGTYAVHYDGGAWNPSPTPDAVTDFGNIALTNELFGVAAVSATDVWAVGFYRDASLFEYPLALHYTCDNEPGPVTLSSLTLAATSVMGGSSTTGTVMLSAPAPTGGVTVALSSNRRFVTVPASVVIAAGEAAGTFVVSTSPGRASRSATITASSAGVTLTSILLVTR